MSKLLWLIYEMCSVAWFTVGLALVWAYPMVRVRYASLLDGHALSWPAPSRGAPASVRLATAGALALAGLLLFVEPAIWPPLFSQRLGVTLSIVGVVEAYFLEVAARDMLRRAPHAHVAAISVSIALVFSRLAIVFMFSWARVPAPAEQQLPLPLAVWPPIVRNGALVLALAELGLCLVARRALRMADASAVLMGAAEAESRDRYRRTFFPRVLLSAVMLALGLTHAPGSDATLFRWLGSWDPMDEAVVP